MPIKNKRNKTLIATSIILIIIAGGLCYFHFDFYKIPKSRIGLNETYTEMPEDSFHHYINLPIDHNQPSLGFFRGFYQFSPHFYKNNHITFLLTDGQMELVSTKTDFQFFENVLRKNAYVLIGVRGHSPTLFPEVYKNGKVDYGVAEKLFSSDQQIEDIELIRLDLIKKGILRKDDKINIFGASGAGILAQQYLSKYGKNLNRVILESTGAPDLAQRFMTKYSPDFEDFNPVGAKMLNGLLKQKSIDKQILCNILYQKGRTDKSPREAQIGVIRDLQNGGSLWTYQLKPLTNLSLLNYLIKSPAEIAARVRWFELVGNDLLKYDSRKETNLLYEFSAKAVSDLLAYHKINKIPAKKIMINRGSFTGDVLILKGTEDVVFSDDINRKIQQSFPNSELLFFKDGHRMQNDPERYILIRNTFLIEGLKSEKFIKLVSKK